MLMMVMVVGDLTPLCAVKLALPDRAAVEGRGHGNSKKRAADAAAAHAYQQLAGLGYQADSPRFITRERSWRMWEGVSSRTPPLGAAWYRP
jgi:hypothetical protein